MGEDERLREALHELEVLRERERRALSETSALLECVEAFAKAPDPGAATADLLRHVHAVTGAACILILEAEPPAAAPPPIPAAGRLAAPDRDAPATASLGGARAYQRAEPASPMPAATGAPPAGPGAGRGARMRASPPPAGPAAAPGRESVPPAARPASPPPHPPAPPLASPLAPPYPPAAEGRGDGAPAADAAPPSASAPRARLLRHWPDAASPGLETGGHIAPPVDLFDRARNVADLDLAGTWAGEIDVSPYRSLLSAPLPDPFLGASAGRGRRAAPAAPRAICLFHRDRAGFGPAQRSLLARLAPLFGRALAGERLASDNALLAAVIEGASAGVAIADASRPDAPLVYVNAAFEALSGYPADAALGRNCRFLSAEAPDATERARLRAALARGEGGRFLVRNRRRDGALFWNELHLFAVRDGHGRPRHFVATQSDVTSRIDAEREAERLRQRLAQALGVIDDAVLMIGADGQVIFRNAALVAAFPAPGPDWAPGTAFAENHAAHRAALAAGGGAAPLPDWAALDRLASATEPREAELPDGRTVLLRARRDGDGTTVLTAADVTRLKRVEATLQLRIAAIEAAQDGILLVDAAERIVYLNGAAAALLGVARADDALGRPWHAFYEGGADAVRAGQSERARRPGADGRMLTHDIKRSEVSAADGQVLVVRDVTERLAEEARQADLRAALARVQRQDAVSQLAGGLSHDFNNLLAAINGAASQIAADTGVSESVYERALRIASAGQSAMRLVARLRELGAPGRARMAVDLREVLAGLPARAAAAGAGEIALRMDRPAASDAGPMGPAASGAPEPSPGPPPAAPPEPAPECPPIVEADAEDLLETCLALVRAVREVARRPDPLVLTLSCFTPDAVRELPVGMLSAGRAYACLEVRDPAGPGRDSALAALEAALARAQARGGAAQDAGAQAPGAGFEAHGAAAEAQGAGTAEGRQEAGLGLAMAALQARAAQGGLEIAELGGRAQDGSGPAPASGRQTAGACRPGTQAGAQHPGGRETGAADIGARNTGTGAQEAVAQTTGAQRTGPQATGAWATDAPDTPAPATDAPDTDAPDMGAQATGAGATGAGARGAPDTGAPWQGAARADAPGAEARADRAPPAAGPVTAYRLYWPLRRGAGHQAQDRQPAPTGPSLQGATLLVVDGDRESGEVLHAFLEGLGADVALCDSAEIAAEAAREEPEAWTALIIDYDMPGMSGGALVDGLRPVAPDLPVFVVTAMADRMSDPRILEAPNTRLYPRPADLGALAQDLAALPPRGPARFA